MYTYYSMYAYRYTQRQDGAQKMHRSIRSKDVEQYPGDSKPREISLRKEEDIEYQSGSLKSSSGTATVALAASKKQRLQMEMEEEENDSFAVKGSYRLQRIHCYTLKHSEAWKRRRRSTGDAVKATLSATIDKRTQCMLYYTVIYSFIHKVTFGCSLNS